MLAAARDSSPTQRGKDQTLSFGWGVRISRLAGVRPEARADPALLARDARGAASGQRSYSLSAGRTNWASYSSR